MLKRTCVTFSLFRAIKHQTFIYFTVSDRHSHILLNSNLDFKTPEDIHSTNVYTLANSTNIMCKIDSFNTEKCHIRITENKQQYIINVL